MSCEPGAAVLAGEIISGSVILYCTQGIEKGIEIGIEKGWALGMEKGKLEVARRLMAKGMTSEAAKITGLNVMEWTPTFLNGNQVPKLKNQV